MVKTRIRKGWDEQKAITTKILKPHPEPIKIN